MNHYEYKAILKRLADIEQEQRVLLARTIKLYNEEKELEEQLRVVKHFPGTPKPVIDGQV